MSPDDLSPDDLESDRSFPQLPLPKLFKRAASGSAFKDASTIRPQEADDILPTTSAESLAAEAIEAAAETIGPYVLLDRLGQGGMGVVYLAKSQSLNRLVALKVLSEGNYASEELQRRFESEARIAANLQHANIVRVFDFGQSSRGLYIAFEYIQGRNLAEAIRGTPQPPRQSALTLLALAKALQYAHQQGVIHRDLKPANILLDVDGNPKITDFGLARSMSDANMTRTGEIMGTPAYMSPEQATGASGLIGPASDIYSLGAILFELLTGTPPFRGPDPMAVVVAVATMEPPQPRQLDRAIPRDIETICLKCLEKQSSRRYTSAGALAADLERFLDGQAILAKPASLMDKGAKLAKRYPAATALLFLTILSLITFMTFSQWKNRQLANALARSDSNFRDALQAAQRRIDSVGQPADQTLEEELQFFNTIRSRPDGGVSTRYEVPVAASLAGQVLVKLGRFDEALGVLHDAETSLVRLERDDPVWSDWYRSELASVFVTRSQAEQSLGELDKAEDSLKRGLVLFQQLATSDGDNFELLRAQAALLNNLGILASRTNQIDLAINYHRESLSLKDQLLKRDSRNAKILSEKIVSLANLGSNLTFKGELEEAIQHLQQADSSFASLPAAVRNSMNSRLSEAGIHLSLARVSGLRVEFEAMIEQFTVALKLLRQLVIDYAEVPDYQTKCADVEIELGRALMTSDEIPANPSEELSEPAKQLLRRALEQFQSAASRYSRLSQTYPTETSYAREFQSLQPGIAELRSALGESSP